MATHFVYEDPTEDPTLELCQGDVLRRGADLLSIIRTYFPYYANHEDYKYFMVVTQTCDLVRRAGKACKSPYITLAAVKPLASALLLEAAKEQEEWQKTTRVIGNRVKEKLVAFLSSLMDNNKAGYFYLHEDQTLGIEEECCAFLQLTITLHAEHYDACLGSKIAQLKEPFQAKLGWLIGSMYSRVATTEWNSEIPEEPLSKVVSRTLRKTFVTYEDGKISEAIADLRKDGSLETKSPTEIAEYVKKKQLIPRSTKFRDRAIEVFSRIKIAEPLQGKVGYTVRSDEGLKATIVKMLTGGGEGENAGTTVEEKAREIINLVADRAVQALSDDTLPGRDKYISTIVRQLLEDAVLKKLLS